MKKSGLALTLSVFAVASFSSAQEKVDLSNDARMRSEELEHSQILHTLHMLTDRYGPRVTGTPNHELAAKWAITQMTQWGMKNGHLEPWEFGHPGWLNETADGHIIAPVKENLKFEILAWTPSTKGKVTGSVVQITAPEGPVAPVDPAAATAGGRGGRGGGGGRGPARLGPTKDEMTAWVSANKDKVKGKIVMAGKAAVIPVNFDPPAKRTSDESIKARYAADGSDGGRGGRGGRGGGGGGRGGATPDPNRLTAAQVGDQIDAMLVANGALVRINDAARGEGIIVAQQHRGYDPSTAVPTVIVRNDDYGRMERLIEDGEDVKMTFDIVNHIYPEGKISYNTIAEIPGTDRTDEVVMLGGHLDSWHSATGATDNAIGCAIMMEAAHLIEAAGIKPRRTIRVALWSGEEEGLLGSLAYVKQHFGTAENPKPEWFKLDAYFNVDTGTGRIRGAGVFGPPEAAAVIRPVLAQFAEWGVGGASPSSSRAVGGTDSTSFNNAGLPGIGMSQDPIEYNSMTHHTNLDTYERIVPDDVKKDAVIIAAQVLHLANRDQMLPRFTKETMPAPVPARTF